MEFTQDSLAFQNFLYNMLLKIEENGTPKTLSYIDSVGFPTLSAKF